jgi:hypothetical protein
MNDPQVLEPFAHRVILQAVGPSKTSDEVTAASVAVHTKLLGALSPLFGDIGSLALFRRSLKLSEATFPLYSEVRSNDREGLLNALHEILRKQSPNVILTASVALLAAYINLLETFIGEQLTRQLLQDAWPDLHTFPPRKD